jgi:metal-responsive CopG/Arc/MetJ family transcriptional regulator
MHMRMHIDIDEELVARIDASAGQRGRSRFIREAVVTALDQRARAELIRSSRGAIQNQGHEWDQDPAGWVRDQRRSDRRRVG